jgi:hypothetical protein
MEVELFAEGGVEGDEGRFGGSVVGCEGACCSWAAEEGGDGYDVSLFAREEGGEERAEDVELRKDVYVEGPVGGWALGYGRVRNG